MKSLTYSLIIAVTLIGSSFAAKDPVLEDPEPKPSVGMEKTDEGEDKDDSTNEFTVPFAPGNKGLRSNNPITDPGISLQEFLDYGMVHVDDPNQLLEKPGQGDSGKPQKVDKIQRFYVHHVMLGSGGGREGSRGGNDSDVYIEALSEDDGSDEQQDDPDELEEEADISKLAPRH